MSKTKKLVLVSILTALSTLLTMVPQIPTGVGYVHFGDSIIYITALLLDPVSAMVVGGLGHALADYLSGYAIFVVPTLLIKAAVGLTVSCIAQRGESKVRISIAFASALVLITAGYFVTEVIFWDYSKALLSLLSSPVQWLMSIAATSVLFPLVKRPLSSFINQ